MVNFCGFYDERSEIRDFPKAVTLLDSDLLQHVLRGIRNCIGLTSCIWTRDGSLNSEILEAFHHCPDLRELEFNGHNDGNYDPKLLLGITSLRRISIIMPSAMVLSQLEPWFSKMSDRLRNLTLICKSSRIVTDSVLETLAPSLVNLDHLHITGCPKVTHRGVWALVSTNQSGLKGLGLEGVSLAFDMNLFAKQCVASGSLTQLRAITLTVHHQIPLKAWVQGVIDLLSLSKIELFQIYSTGAFFESPLTDELWDHLVTTHSQSLIRFSVHRMMIDMDAIHKICVSCPNLEQLFVVVDPNYLDELADSLAHARKMRTIHINFPLEAFIDTVPILRPDQALEVLNKCSPTVVQFGCNAKVWQVVRKIVRASGELRTEAALAPYENPDVPEQFLVVRT
ncbi:hypothetical protein NLJ89_g10769 [Agrocybe chaxingu]|uniref:Uncharacterized protein n=1 Tax=Agrocybe chaxingu TaxID=84603 RepID=A0A9W8JR64_9AGAR|nr:hypothetical protein NLJ89_g10769 [Agrocybe chaxingu]